MRIYIYQTVFKTELLTEDIRPFGHKVDFAFIINDILHIMAIHFGLAVQEICVATLPRGAMNPIRKAANPIIATLGGLFGPIGLYFLLSVFFESANMYDEIPPEDVATAVRVA
jgi:NhaA family Na+:H+ antiporter